MMTEQQLNKILDLYKGGSQSMDRFRSVALTVLSRLPTETEWAVLRESYNQKFSIWR